MDEKAEPQTAGEAIDAGRIEFVMHGERLKGKFALIRMKPRGKGKPQWLLMKLKDEFAEAGSEDAPKPAAKAQSRCQGGRTGPHAGGRPRPRRSVELTHPDRVIYPEAGLTKEDVFAYYEKVADRLLPFLKDRPITLERLPEGLAEEAPAFLAEGHAGLLPRLDPPHRAGDRAGQDRPLRPGQRRGDAALPREPGDAHLPRLGVAGEGPRPARLRALRPRPGQGVVRRRRSPWRRPSRRRSTRRASSPS